MSTLAVLTAFMTLAAPPAGPATFRSLRIDPPISDAKEAINLSGAACAIDAGKTCLLVADEIDKGRRVGAARTFTISGNVLRPGAELQLLPPGFDETDVEGVAVTGGFYYLTGSHGLSKKNSEFQPSRFFVYRVKADPLTGAPVGQVARTDKLRAILKATSPINAHAEKPLADHGVNIEGLAARGGDLFFAFRGPVVGGHAFVMRVAIDSLFGSAGGKPAVFPITMPEGTGLRDIAAVDGGFLLLTGPEADMEGPADVRYWDGKSKHTGPAIMVPGAPGAKPEALMPLADRGDSLDVLLLSDGVAQGNPTVMTVTKASLGLPR